MIAEILFTILISANPSIDDLPKPEGDSVYCWLLVSRDKEGRLNGFEELCREE